MPEKRENRTIEEVRRKNAEYQRRFYKKHQKSEQRRKRNYARKKRKIHKKSNKNSF